MHDLRQTIIELMGQLGSSREAREYLREFSSVDQRRFAVVKVGGAVLRDDLDTLAGALGFLHQLGLRPVVLHGAGPQLDHLLESADQPVIKRDGVRVTDETTLALIRPEIYRQNQRLVEALENRGVKARGIQHGVFLCDYLDADTYGLVGTVQQVEKDSLRQAVNADAIPVLTCLGETRSGQLLNVNADEAARALVLSIRPRKVIFLTPTGGLLDDRGQLIPAVSLQTDYKQLMAEDWVHSGMRLKLQQIHDLLQALPVESSVSITSAAHLTRELFTHQGAGTLVQRGEQILCHAQPDSAHLSRFRELIESAFNRRLQHSWPDRDRIMALYELESGRAGALLLRGQDGLPYLDKFAATQAAQGEGLGSALWRRLAKDHPQLYWRAREANPVAGWYLQRADQAWRRDGWFVFTRGVSDHKQQQKLIVDALGRDSGWTDEGVSTS